MTPVQGTICLHYSSQQKEQALGEKKRLQNKQGNEPPLTAEEIAFLRRPAFQDPSLKTVEEKGWENDSRYQGANQAAKDTISILMHGRSTFRCDKIIESVLLAEQCLQAKKLALPKLSNRTTCNAYERYTTVDFNTFVDTILQSSDPQKQLEIINEEKLSPGQSGAIQKLMKQYDYSMVHDDMILCTPYRQYHVDGRQVPYTDPLPCNPKHDALIKAVNIRAFLKNLNVREKELVQRAVGVAVELENNALMLHYTAQYYRALFLRIVAYHHIGSFSDAMTFLEKQIEKYNITTLCESTTTEAANQQANNFQKASFALNSFRGALHGYIDTQFDQALTEHAMAPSEALLRSHPNHQSLCPNQTIVMVQRASYSKGDIALLLKKLNLSGDSEIGKQLSSLNGIDSVSSLESKAFREALKNLNNKTTTEQLMMLREALYRITGQKVWLRLEQATAILLAMQKKDPQDTHSQNNLFQIDTSEGKTLIIALIALLKKIQHPDQPVMVLTHTHSEAQKMFKETQKLASLLDIELAAPQSNPKNVKEQGINFVSIAHAVMSYLVEQNGAVKCNRNNQTASSVFERSITIIDEIDNVAIDAAAVTEIQMTEDEQGTTSYTQDDFVACLDMIYAAVPNEHSNSSVDDIVTLLQKNHDFQQNSYAKQIQTQDSTTTNGRSLKYWVHAAQLSQQKEKDKDYTIMEKGKFKFVRIVHQHTDGRRDDHSIWGKGLHQMVAIRERQQDEAITIPPDRPVVANMRIRTFLEKLPHKIGFTGSLGEDASKTHLQAVVESDSCFVFPRAKRHHTLPSPHQRNHDSKHFPLKVEDQAPDKPIEEVSDGQMEKWDRF